MKKKITYFLFPLLFFINELKSETFTYEQVSRVLERCANSKYSSGLFLKILPGWGDTNDVPHEIIAKNDESIQYYIKKYPINFMFNKKEINQKMKNFNELYFEAIRDTVDSETKKKIDIFNNNHSKEDESQNNIDKRHKFFKSLEHKSLKPELVNSTKQKYDQYFNDFFLPMFDEHMTIVWASKSRFFDKMNLKNKLFIDEYKYHHLNCEQEFKKGKITFYEKWK